MAFWSYPRWLYRELSLQFGYNGQKWLVKPYISRYTSDNYNTFDETRFIKGIFYAKNKKKKMS